MASYLLDEAGNYILDEAGNKILLESGALGDGVILTEDGDFILTEDGDRILLEDGIGVPVGVTARKRQEGLLLGVY